MIKVEWGIFCKKIGIPAGDTVGQIIKAIEIAKGKTETHESHFAWVIEEAKDGTRRTIATFAEDKDWR